MSIAAFDTHAAVTALREAGFDERQAEGVVATVRDAVAEGVATRTDLAEVKAELKADVAEVKVDLAEVKAELKADVAEVKADLAEVKVDLAEVKAELKADVAEVKAELKADIAEVKTEVKADVAEVRTDVARLETRMFLGILTAVGTIVALVKLLP